MFYSTMQFYALLNFVYWGALGLLVVTGYWPVMSIGLSLATGVAVHGLDIAVQPFLLFAAATIATRNEG